MILHFLLILMSIIILSSSRLICRWGIVWIVWLIFWETLISILQFTLNRWYFGCLLCWLGLYLIFIHKLALMILIFILLLILVLLCILGYLLSYILRWNILSISYTTMHLVRDIFFSNCFILREEKLWKKKKFKKNVLFFKQRCIIFHDISYVIKKF